MDEPEEDDFFLAHDLSVLGEWATAEGETTEAIPYEVCETDAVMRVENPQDAGSAPPDIIEIAGSPSFTESMFDEA